MSSRGISLAAFLTVKDSDISETLVTLPSTFLPSFSLTETLVPLVTALKRDQSFVPAWASRVTGDNSNEITSTTMTAICFGVRSEEHTSELQSQSNLVCRLLLEK